MLERLGVTLTLANLEFERLAREASSAQLPRLGR